MFCDVDVASSDKNTYKRIIGYPKRNVETTYTISLSHDCAVFKESIYDLQLVVNQPYDEALEVNDDEEVASTFTPSPRPVGGKLGGYNRGEQIIASVEAF